MAEGSLVRVSVRVRAETKLGQFVGIALSTSNHFDKSSAMAQLVTTPEAYPVWYTKTPIVVPSGQTTMYKYCLLEGNSVQAFEIGEARLIPLGENNIDVMIEDKFSTQQVDGFEGVGSSEKNLLRKLTDIARTEEENEKENGKFSIEGGGRLFIACYHLPVSVRRDASAEDGFVATWNDSLISRSTDGKSVSQGVKTFWVGTVTVDNAPTLSKTDIEQLTALLTKMDCIPVFLDAAVLRLAYHGFCKEIMWPIFHNVDQLDHIHAAWNLPAGNRGGAGGGIGAAVAAQRTPQEAAAAAAAAFMSANGSPSNNNSSNNSNNTSSSSSNSSSSTSNSFTTGGNGGEEIKWKGDEERYYAAYETVSKVFDAKLGPLLNKNDVVWVHDYHLMLLPKMVRERDLKVKIVFFLHIPFPTSQIFRSLPKATQLLQSMCCSDVIGFHAFDHTRHFLNATKRILGMRSRTLDGGLLAVFVQDRHVIVTMSHVSVEPDKLDKLLALKEVQDRAAELREKYKGRKIIVGVDVCHRLSGVSLKLAAMDKLLTDYSNTTSGGVVLVQRCLRPGVREQDEETTSVDVRKMVDMLNTKFGQGGKGIVIDYEEVRGSLSLPERLSLWLASDVFLLSAIREGLNLMPLEYIYARRELESAGVVVASEFSTVSSSLSGSIKINPFNALSVADALDKAVNMTPKECNQRRTRDISFVSTHPSSLWTKQILSDLRLSSSPSSSSSSSSSSASASSSSSSSAAQPNKEAHAPLQEPVNVKYLVECFKAAGSQGLTPKGRRLLVFDYGGTLLFKERFDVYIKQTLSAISGRRPTPRVMMALKVLSEDPNNVVMVMTGLTRLKLGDTFKGLKNITLVTSNGLVYSWGENLLSEEDKARISTLGASAKASSANSLAAAVAAAAGAVAASKVKAGEFHDDLFSQVDDEGREWRNFDFHIDWTAVCKIAVPIMSQYTFRTNGTCLSPRFVIFTLLLSLSLFFSWLFYLRATDPSLPSFTAPYQH